MLFWVNPRTWLAHSPRFFYTPWDLGYPNTLDLTKGVHGGFQIWSKRCLPLQSTWSHFLVMSELCVCPLLLPVLFWPWTLSFVFWILVFFFFFFKYVNNNALLFNFNTKGMQKTSIFVWKLLEKMCNRWFKVWLTIVHCMFRISVGEFQVVFEAVVGSGPRGDIALDDLSISGGHCKPAGKMNQFLVSSCYMHASPHI